jgi:hypothetical protein
MSGIINSAGSRSGVIGTTELDYEEGTYDVTFTASSGNDTTDTTRNALSYTKIGNRVTISGYARTGDSWTGTGNLSVNLPFVSAPHDGSYTGYSWGQLTAENLRSTANDPQSHGAPYYNPNDFAIKVGPSTSTADILVIGGSGQGIAASASDAGPQYTAATQMVAYTNFIFDFTYQTTY